MVNELLPVRYRCGSVLKRIEITRRTLSSRHLSSYQSSKNNQQTPSLWKLEPRFPSNGKDSKDSVLNNDVLGLVTHDAFYFQCRYYPQQVAGRDNTTGARLKILEFHSSMPTHTRKNTLRNGRLPHSHLRTHGLLHRISC